MEDAMEKKVSELLQQINLISELQRRTISVLPQHRQLDEFTAELYDTLEQLRFVVKYILFDLEATRRENESLRKILDEYCGR